MPRLRSRTGAGLIACVLLLPLSVARAVPEPGSWETSYPCGTVVTPAEAATYLEQLESGFPSGAAALANPPYYVRIAPHIVRHDDGTGGLPPSRFTQAVADANLHFQDAEIVFLAPGEIDFIDDDTYYTTSSLAEIDSLRTTNPVANAINMYFTENLDYESGALCGISAFTFSAVHAIAMRNSCTANDATSNHSTFSHEVGHYFDLFHTHEPAFGTEYVDGSNCTSAGDLVCDTPADPQLGSSNVNSGTCAYTGSQTDPHGDPYAPDPSQLMSYSLKHCRDNFSPGSIARAQDTLLNGGRSSLLTSVVAAPALADRAPEGARVDLSSPRPNPTAGLTELRLTLPAAGWVDVTVYDVRGTCVRTIAYGPFEAGAHAVGWDGRDSSGRRAATGLYFARAEALGERVTRKIQLLR